MNFLSLIPYYLAWHYSASLPGFFKLWGNFMWFLFNFFSISILLKTLFSPFRRIRERYQGGLNIEDWLESFTVTFIMRIVGFLIRSFVIIIGLSVMLVGLLVGIASFLVWLVWPFLLVALYVFGVIGLFF